MGYHLNRLDNPVLWQGKNLCELGLAFIIDWRVVLINNFIHDFFGSIKMIESALFLIGVRG